MIIEFVDYNFPVYMATLSIGMIILLIIYIVMELVKE